MSVGILFWILFIVGLVVFGFGSWRDRTFDSGSLFWWVLIFLLGIGTFGWPIK